MFILKSCVHVFGHFHTKGLSWCYIYCCHDNEELCPLYLALNHIDKWGVPSAAIVLKEK